MFIADRLEEYRILDAGDGMKLEDWNGIILSRPDPQVIWKKEKPAIWDKADAVYERSRSGGGKWVYRRSLPEQWSFRFRDMSMIVRPTGFKHTGIFPEQSANWDFIIDNTREGDRILNLFAYTGGATLVAAVRHAEVTHVDASKGMIQWAKENQAASGLEDEHIRYIVDDCLKFVRREIKRGKKYEGIIMDPPSYGRGTGGELWKLEDTVEELIEECAKLLSDNPRYFIINSYTTGLSSVVTGNILKKFIKHYDGTVESGDLVIPIEDSELVLPCGTTTRWFR